MLLSLVVLTIVELFQFANCLQIGPLLSTCVDACQRGCNEIRSIQAARAGNINKNDNLKVEYKDPDDVKSALTAADTAAQHAIVGALKAEWGKELRIVGEEDDDDDADTGKTSFKPLQRDRFEEDIGETAEIDISDITIFVDPLDGTREFVEERLENCQVLVGIAIGGESVAGVVGIPFPAGKEEGKEDEDGNAFESTIIYGLDGLGTGVVGAALTRGPFPLERNIDGVKYPRPHHATGDSTASVLVAAKEAAIQRFGGSNVIYGGAGNKILAAALGEVTCSMASKVGGPWDLCAPEAILKAMGGQITDLFGDEIAMYRLDAPPRCNERGFIASPPGSDEFFHQALVNAVTASPEVQTYREEIEACAEA